MESLDVVKIVIVTSSRLPSIYHLLPTMSNAPRRFILAWGENTC